MGDGINDAPALRAADVGISVDTATDIAKESADLILLEKDLMVLDGGVVEGRKVFANIVKYIRMGASSNFGNMFSVLGASAFLPFLPMAPIQVLTNNLLYDFSQVPIPVDAVDEEQVSRPRPWNIGEIKRFILFIGPISSIFDYTTFFVMLWVFSARDPSRAALFQTGWFVESLMTQTLIIHVIRTNKIPFLQSRASWPLTVTTLSIMAFGAWLPYLSAGLRAGLYAPAAAVLADPDADTARLRGPYAGRQSVAVCASSGSNSDDSATAGFASNQGPKPNQRLLPGFWRVQDRGGLKHAFSLKGTTPHRTRRLVTRGSTGCERRHSFHIKPGAGGRSGARYSRQCHGRRRCRSGRWIDVDGCR